MNQEQSLIPADKSLPEITIKVIVLSIILSMTLAISNAYLALKIGFLTSASIPAAVIAMGLLRFFKKSNILENNLIQTAASAGEAVAGGIVYTIPALVIIQFWTGFNYVENFFVALIGGVLGVMFSIPLRRLLVSDKKLKFPEGRAIAEVLKISNAEKLGVSDIFLGGFAGAFIEFCQTGIKLLADSTGYWFKAGNTLLGFGLGFSPAMIGAGFLIGAELSFSIFIGAFLSWFVFAAVLPYFFPDLLTTQVSATEAAKALWGAKIRYIGIGAMLVAGLLTLASLVKPLIASIQLSLRSFKAYGKSKITPRTQFDLPFLYVALISIVATIGLYYLYHSLFPMAQLNIDSISSATLILTALFYTLFAGFIFCAITAYFSGMVGVSASPGSSVVIASLLIAALLVFVIVRQSGIIDFSPNQIKACEAITIICTAMITGMAAISNDNMQDLKVGYLLGSTPWKQQIMLLIGVVAAATIIPPVMQVLYNVYGIAGVMPRAGMDPSLSLPAPPAAVMATLSSAVFQHQIPWNMLMLGGAISLAVRLLNLILRQKNKSLSVLGVAIGIYLPLASSMPIFIGGLIAYLMRKQPSQSAHRKTILACGLIAGAALLDVALAIPFSIMHNPDALNLAPAHWTTMATLLSIITTLGLYYWFKKTK